MMTAGIGECVVVTDLSIIVICWIRVAALAVIKSMADRVVVISLHTLDLVFFQEWKDSIRMRAKTSQVAETVNRIDTLLAGILESGFQGQKVAVDSAKAGNA